MIISDFEYENIRIPILLEFGHGDIGVSTGYGKNHVEIAFSKIEPREIGSHEKLGDGHSVTVKELNPSTLFLFDKVASIDVVIEALQKAKEHLEKLSAANPITVTSEWNNTQEPNESH